MGHGGVVTAARGFHHGLRGPSVLASAVLCAACNDRPVSPALEWPSPDEITERMDDNCLLSDAVVRCWGFSAPDGISYDEDLELMLMLRDESLPGSPLPVLDLGNDARVVSIATGLHSRCAVLEGRGVKCWGDNGALYPDTPGFHHSLGVPDISVRLGDEADERGDALPFMDVGTMGDLGAVRSRGVGFYVLDADGRIKGWGPYADVLGLEETGIRGDESGDLGEGLPFVDLGRDFSATGLCAGPGHACAWTDAGALKCWGNNDHGELGVEPLGTTLGDEPGEMGDALPFVDLGDVRVVQVVCGQNTTCALTDEGRVKCWGAAEGPHSGDGPPEEPPSTAPLGLGDGMPRVPPLGDSLPFVDLGEDARVVALGGDRSSVCALLDGGQLKCWGVNSQGQLGQEDDEARGDEPGEMGDDLDPIDLGRDRWIRSFSVGFTSCALLDDDSVKCWGRLTDAGREVGTMGDQLAPVANAEDLGLAP